MPQRQRRLFWKAAGFNPQKLSSLGAFLMPQPPWGTEINTPEQGEKGIVFRSLRIYPPKC